MTFSSLVRSDNVAIFSEIGASVDVYTPSVTVDATDSFVTSSSLGNATAYTAYIRDLKESEVLESDGKRSLGDAVGYFSHSADIQENQMVARSGKLYKVTRILQHLEEGNLGYTKVELTFVRAT